MTIDEAIKVFDVAIHNKPVIPGYKLQIAHQLGIEALKRAKAGRPAPPSLAYLPLPGETK